MSANSFQQRARALARRAVGDRWKLAKSALYAPALMRSRANPLVRAGVSILGPDESIDLLVDSDKSLARFGDGELELIMGVGGPRFQRGSSGLAERLREVLNSSRSDLMLGLTHCLVETAGVTEHERLWWGDFVRRHGQQLAREIPSRRTFLDTMLTRPYIPHDDVDQAMERFGRLRQLWAGRDVLFVEGVYSRSGIGNDLFDDAASITRLIGPPSDAFDHLEEIAAATEELGRDRLVLTSLGPTATVLAHDVSAAGIRCVDIGHLDMEYMWARIGRGRVPLPGRLVNEIAQQARLDLAPEQAELHASQVAGRIGA